MYIKATATYVFSGKVHANIKPFAVTSLDSPDTPSKQNKPDDIRAILGTDVGLPEDAVICLMFPTLALLHTCTRHEEMKPREYNQMITGLRHIMTLWQQLDERWM